MDYEAEIVALKKRVGHILDAVGSLINIQKHLSTAVRMLLGEAERTAESSDELKKLLTMIGEDAKLIKEIRGFEADG